MPFEPNDLCLALRHWRIRARLRQAAVAECLGVTQGQVSRWESGRDVPRPHNVEAIRRLIWGPEADPLTALRLFVEQSGQHLLLIDSTHAIVARSVPLRASPGPLDRFGWVLDPEANPAVAPALRRFRQILEQPGGVVGLRIVLPFRHEGEAWCATIRKIIYSVAGTRICLAEPRFAPAAPGDGTEIRFEETRLSPDDRERHALTLWRHPPADARTA